MANQSAKNITNPYPSEDQKAIFSSVSKVSARLTYQS